MDKPKRWQPFLIIAVLALTIYNILPTVFFYTKPLRKEIDAPRAEVIAQAIAKRTNSLEKESISWLSSFCKNNKISPLAITLDSENPQLIHVRLRDTADAQKFRKTLPRAGALISFPPAQLSLFEGVDEKGEKNVTVQRRVPVSFPSQDLSSFFQFASKRDEQGQPSELYRALVLDRALQLGCAIGGSSENAELLTASLASIENPLVQESISQLSRNITSFAHAFGPSSHITGRYFASFTQTESTSRGKLVQQFISQAEQFKDKLRLERIALQKKSSDLKEENGFLEAYDQQHLEALLTKEELLSDALAILRSHNTQFAAGKQPLTYASFGGSLRDSALKLSTSSDLQTISLEHRNPFITSMNIDWKNEEISLVLYPDVQESLSPSQNKTSEIKEQFVFDEIARISRVSGEDLSPALTHFTTKLSKLSESKSFLALRLGKVAQSLSSQVQESILAGWHPEHRDLKREVFPIWDYETYTNLPVEERQLGLVIYAPPMHNKMPPKGFRMSSIYVIAKGLEKMVAQAQDTESKALSAQLTSDFESLKGILQKNGFYAFSGNLFSLSPEHANDVIFENDNYYQPLLMATREEFSVHGTKRYALLEFTDVEQRMITANKIETRIHEDLLKWRDDYRAAKLGIKGMSSEDVPAPTKNTLLSNVGLSLRKYFRGDDRKILKWGLDLSGGKTVQIELRDTNGRLITAESDIKQGIDELYKRVNKMGVSEVSIRQEGNLITLDFPGSQALSAAELVQASTMYFHVVNEQFSSTSPTLGTEVRTFLQEIWNEAVVTGKKSTEEINFIAWKNLYGQVADNPEPRTPSAKRLYDAGLRLAHPVEGLSSNHFDDTFSKITLLRGDDFTDWSGEANPLLIVFRNYVLEGANLENVLSGYDSTRGNFLSFGIASSHTNKERGNPREDLFLWTSHFSKEKIGGTPLEKYSRGHGWRMAVILNGSVVSAPTLDSPLRDSAMITGSFSGREINQLETDLKAGSLSFTPRILSEKNVSPELGSHERALGIAATLIALLLVIGSMVLYYRFGGLVASIAVICNLLIIWATLQNLQATLSLAGIAGIILTLGMAVDANVLVFERIREEFAATGRLSHAVHAGYKKAFSAIVDSNLTTILAALILLNFDSGPIKGFAITLIIGITSSMFTALFMTRFFFSKWVQNPRNKKLTMMNWIRGQKFNFLAYGKKALYTSIAIFLIGGYLLVSHGKNALGMDFTGGFALNVELQDTGLKETRNSVEQALRKAGLSSEDFEVRQLNSPTNLRIFLSRNLEEKQGLLANLETPKETKNLLHSYEANPKITWVVKALEADGLLLAPSSLSELSAGWTEVSGQISDSMRTSALIGLAIALIGILVYITFRFEFTYAVSATLCTLHDLFFAIAAIGILQACGVKIQIDLNIIAALMTIIGYSLNDTIIVFDRIREDIAGKKTNSFAQVINQALNTTLSRTIMTSATTLLVLLPLIALGGSTIFGFSLVMAIGVIFGTLSSLFIASPLLLFFQKREAAKVEKLSYEPN